MWGLAVSILSSEFKGNAPEINVVEAAGNGHMVVPDARLLFGGDFTRTGHDLYVHNDGEPSLFIQDYFLTDPPADLYAPDGSVLGGNVVARLAGPLAPAQYAQSESPETAAGPIGQVETQDGAASVQRADGSVVDLAVGTKIFANDVVQTGDGGSVSITFADGTIFTLAPGSRMVIDHLIYDPAGSANSAGFNLVQGGFVFIAGQVAKSGEMDVNTPTATMGIRGTTVVVEIEAQNGVVTSEFTLTHDPDGGTGIVELRDLSGNLIANIDRTDVKWIVSSEGETREVERTLQDDADDNLLVAEAVAAYNSAFGRVNNGDTFVTLGDPNGTGNSDLRQDTPGTDIDLDSIDDPDSIDPSEQDQQEPDDPENRSFDEGRLNTDDHFDAPDVVVAGLEDAGEESTISGVIALEGEAGNDAVFVLDRGPRNGDATVNPDGTFDYVPEENFNGEDDFTYVVTTGDGLTEGGTVTVEVIPVNDPPEAADRQASVIEDGNVSGFVTGTDIDGDVLSYSIETAAQNGSVVLLATGAYSYTPNPDFSGTDSFVVRVSDPEGASALSEVSVTVAGVNDAPVIAAGGNRSANLTDASGTVVATGVLSASDVDAGSSLVWSGSEQGQYGQFEVSPQGVWTFTLNNAIADGLAAGDLASETFGATVSDGEGGSDSVAVTIFIEGTNDGPVITNEPAAARGGVVEGDEQTSASGQLSARDPDAGSVLVWTGSAVGAYGAFVLSADGGWTYTIDNEAAETLAFGETATESFTATVTDDQGETATQIVTLEVTGTNDAPVVARNTVVEVVQGNTVSGALSASDADSVGPLVFSQGNDGPQSGVVNVSSDGTFEYTPNAGFLGVDRFDIVVTDPEGGFATGTVTVEVESETATGGDGQLVSLGFNREAGPDVAIGSVSVITVPVDSNAINLVVAMDRSGSIGADAWAVQTDAVADALELLATQFSSSVTQVDVQIIPYASFATPLDTMDLQDPDLISAVRNLPYTRGGTNWTAAFNETQNFLESQPADEANFLFFITDGNPTSGDWRSAAAELTGTSNGFTLNIETFGIGGGYNVGNLRVLDPSPVQLESADDLVGALTETPIFQPRLIDFQLTLEVDGTDLGVVADAASPSLIADGLNYDLALADIVGIEDLLGENNRFSARVSFDLDGDETTSEIDLFSTEVFAMTDQAQDTTGQNGSDLMLGSDQDDQMSGGGGNDLILGFAGDDLLNGGAGTDTILAGAGNDTITVADPTGLAGERLDGGAGRDTLSIDLAGNVSDGLLPVLSLSDIEAIDMENGQVNTLELSLSDVIDMSSTADSELEGLLGGALPESAMVYGDAGDELTLLDGSDGGFEQVAGASVTDANGNSFAIYEFISGGNVLATLGVDEDIAVATAPPAA